MAQISIDLSAARPQSCTSSDCLRPIKIQNAWTESYRWIHEYVLQSWFPRWAEDSHWTVKQQGLKNYHISTRGCTELIKVCFMCGCMNIVWQNMCTRPSYHLYKLCYFRAPETKIKIRITLPQQHLATHTHRHTNTRNILCGLMCDEILIMTNGSISHFLVCLIGVATWMTCTTQYMWWIIKIHHEYWMDSSPSEVLLIPQTETFGALISASFNPQMLQNHTDMLQQTFIFFTTATYYKPFNNILQLLNSAEGGQLWYSYSLKWKHFNVSYFDNNSSLFFVSHILHLEGRSFSLTSFPPSFSPYTWWGFALIFYR